MKIDLDERFEYSDDDNFGKQFWRGIVYTIALGAAVALSLIRIGAYIAERFCE